MMLEELLAIRAQLDAQAAQIKTTRQQVTALIDREVQKATQPAEEPPPVFMGS